MKIPKNITLCNLECVAMPNGEVISCGKTIGWVKDFYIHLTNNKDISYSLTKKQAEVIKIAWDLLTKSQRTKLVKATVAKGIRFHDYFGLIIKLHRKKVRKS